MTKEEKPGFPHLRMTRAPDRIDLVANHDPGSDVGVLTRTCFDALMILVRDGLISEARAAERANNLAMALMGEFEFTRIED